MITLKPRISRCYRRAVRGHKVLDDFPAAAVGALILRPRLSANHNSRSVTYHLILRLASLWGSNPLRRFEGQNLSGREIC